MSNVITEPTWKKLQQDAAVLTAGVAAFKAQTQATAALLRAEAAIFEKEIAYLEKENAQSPQLFQLLKKWIGMDYAKKLEWTRFKLRLAQRDLRSLDIS